MKIDLHVHTMISSTCSHIDPEECIEAARAAGLDAICVTEHETLEGGLVMKEIGEKSGFAVFAGMELVSREGHILVYGYGGEIKGVPPAAEIVAMVEEAGGIAVPAHPWRRGFGWYSGAIERPLEETEFARMFKVVEMYNGTNTRDMNRTAEEFCRATGVRGMGGSDAHVISQVGAAFTVFDDEIEDEAGLAAALMGGRFHAELREE